MVDVCVSVSHIHSFSPLRPQLSTLCTPSVLKGVSWIHHSQCEVHTISTKTLPWPYFVLEVKRKVMCLGTFEQGLLEYWIPVGSQSWKERSNVWVSMSYRLYLKIPPWNVIPLGSVLKKNIFLIFSWTFFLWTFSFHALETSPSIFRAFILRWRWLFFLAT